MGLRLGISGLAVAGLALVPLGCGGAQEDYTVVYRPQEEREASHDSTQQRQDARLPPAIRQQAQACLEKHAAQLSSRTYGLRYDALADENGAMTDVKLRNTTLPDSVEQCFRQLIAGMNVSDREMRSRSSGPVSGGERMTRERRGPLGESESQNPLVWLGPFIVEAVGIEVIMEVFVGTIAAVGTIVTKKKKKTCVDEYVACQETPLGSIQVDVRGSSVCDTCRKICVNEGSWPLGFEAVWGWQTCR